MRMKRRLATIKVEFDEEESYAGDDIECFLSNLKEFVEKEGGGYVHATFEVHEHGQHDKLRQAERSRR